MLKQLFTLLVGAVLFLASVYGQGYPQSESILAYRVDKYLRNNLSEGELLLDYVEIVRQPKTQVAIRICTVLPLAKAIRQSKAAPFQIANFLQSQHGYSPDRILFLRSSECYKGRHEISDIEIWVVPQGARMPLAEDNLTINEAEKYLSKKR